MSKATEILKMKYAGASRALIEQELEVSPTYIRAVISRARSSGAHLPNKEKPQSRRGRGVVPVGHLKPIVPSHWQKALAMKRAGFSAWEIQNALPSGGF